jgi:uncharacterized protein with PQ loop repeat
VLTTTEIAGFIGAGLAGAAYVPQISHLIRARCSAGISRLAFGAWFLASFLVTARAIAIHAGVFIVLGGIQIAATTLIVFYATRYKDLLPDAIVAAKDLGAAHPDATAVIVVGRSSLVAHRIVDSAAVSLARHPLPLAGRSDSLGRNGFSAVAPR